MTHCSAGLACILSPHCLFTLLKDLRQSGSVLTKQSADLVRRCLSCALALSRIGTFVVALLLLLLLLPVSV